MKHSSILITLSLFFILGLKAQDIHFSQFYNAPLNINPALAGVFKEDVRFIGNYRSQWQSVPVPYLTFSGSYDMKMLNFRLGNGFFAGGAVFNIDQAGASQLSLAQLGLVLSYTLQLNDLNFLTAGFSLGGAQRSFSVEDLTFHNQFNGDIFDSSLDSRENFRSEQITFSDISAGINWHLQATDRNAKIDIGAAMFHINQPRQSFYDEADSRLLPRLSFYAIGSIELNDKMDLIAHGLSQLQGTYFEAVAGTALRYHLNKTSGNEIALQIGTNFRMNQESDAIIPTVEIHYLSWRAGISYDINLSDFTLATNGNGGPEIAIIYTITKVKPVEAFKACPIF